MVNIKTRFAGAFFHQGIGSGQRMAGSLPPAVFSK
jgi:hypothetical protein